ncbi:50S ribosomal protein L29 [Acholeplasma equirhinis]|uniref:50S ribosomal protein L29 n=1 Tax=Acholeplasma equirhinis TaxID=555393 RepID=UPI00197AF7F1|nr:50S ribosomal protein L29 [Acholeplasma equirhinis]MBN3490948.1 50S ribosomal protein L29 [Acholeplasma equirhinis]
MKLADIRKAKTADLEKKIADLKAELFNLRFQHAVGQLENTAQLRTIKKTIAQMKTVISERGEE